MGDAPQRVLVLVRHSKSDWSAPYGADRDRPLAPRGRLQGPEAGAWLSASPFRLELALVSPAIRSISTWHLVAAELGSDAPPSRLADALYTFHGGDVVNIVRGIDDRYHTVAMVGHNPAFEDVVTELTGEHLAMKTSAIAVIRWPGQWADAGRTTGELLAHGRPPGAYHPRRVGRMVRPRQTVECAKPLVIPT